VSYVVIVSPAAQRAVNYIGGWWRTHRPEAPLYFDEDFDRVLASLRQNPERGFAQPGTKRALVTPRTRHVVVYRVLPRARRVEIVVVRP